MKLLKNTENYFIECVKYIKSKSNIKNIILSGGCALNVCANSEIKKVCPKLEDKAQRGLLTFSYQGAKAYLEQYGYDFAIRRYKPSRKSNQAVIAYKDWCKIAICDFNSLNGITRDQLNKLFEDHRRKKNI